MADSPCSVSTCKNPGKLTCSGCTPPQTRYCSKECQRKDFPAHKTKCPSFKKYNSFIIRARAETSNPKTTDHLEPFTLRSYGNWLAEMDEIKDALGWTRVDEAGKFYPEKGDNYYYYAYTSGGSLEPENKVAGQAMGKKTRGDVVVVRSGPDDSNDYPETFSKTELGKAIDFYKSANPSQVFSEREKSRFSRKMGFSPQMMAGVPHIQL